MVMIHPRLNVLAAAVAVLTTAGCASTSFKASWAAPDARPVSGVGKKVAALVFSQDKSSRYAAETSLARALSARGAEGIPAYTVVPEELLKDKDKAKVYFEKAGIAGVVAMRVVGKDKEMTSTPSTWSATPYYGSFWGGGYYGWGWGAMYDPGYIRTDTIVSVETLVFDLTQDKLVWAGQSTTTNPKKVDAFIRELVTAAAAEMQKAGLIAGK
jgi:hypothetical protein